LNFKPISYSSVLVTFLAFWAAAFGAAAALGAAAFFTGTSSVVSALASVFLAAPFSEIPSINI